VAPDLIIDLDRVVRDRDLASTSVVEAGSAGSGSR
jgi:hypothetical protein